jgi:hypothetical protein
MLADQSKLRRNMISLEDRMAITELNSWGNADRL